MSVNATFTIWDILTEEGRYRGSLSSRVPLSLRSRLSTRVSQVVVAQTEYHTRSELLRDVQLCLPSARLGSICRLFAIYCECSIPIAAMVSS